MSSRTQFWIMPAALTALIAALTITLGMTGRGSARAQAVAPAKAEAKPETKTAAADSRAGDTAAIRAAMKAFVQAFEARDAKAATAHWTLEGEYQREGEGTVRGRAALEAGFAAAFAKTPKVQVETEPAPLRFLSADTALAEGTVTVRTSAAEPAVISKYSILIVREGGQWRIALLRETAAEEASPLGDLAWLVGDWKSIAQANEIATNYSRADGGKFLHVRFTIKEKDRALSGFQVLGVHPGTGDLRAWTFESEGGVGEAVWVRDGEHWTAESSATMADGRVLTSTNVLRRINDDTFTWQSTNRRLEDEELDDLPPTKVTRVKAAK